MLHSPKIPVANKLLVNEEQLFELLDNLRQILPAEMKEAEEIVSQKEQLISRANQEAQKLIAAAQSKAKLLLNNNEIIQKSNQKAHHIEKEVKKETEKQKLAADQYADSVLARLEANVTKTLAIVRNGRQKIARVQNLKV